MINQEDLEYLFLAYDVNLSGILDKNQMYKLLTDIQYPIPDKNIDSQLNFENFTRIIGDIQSMISTDILNPDQICEKIGNTIKLTEFINILAETVNNEDIDEVIKEYVGEEDEINIKNFIN